MKVNPGISPGERTFVTVALINLHVELLGGDALKFDSGVVASPGSLFFKLCSDHLSIEAIPRKSTRLDLARLKDRNISGYECMLWTPQFVVLKNRDGYEVTLRRDGRMIIRKAPSEQVAERAATEIMAVVSNLP